jgi:hypothetical protein
MLVKFTSNKSGEMIMFAQTVHDLFQIIDKECTQRGVFMKYQLPEAIARLHGAIDEEKLSTKLGEMPVYEVGHIKPEFKHQEISRDSVGLVQRVQPLLHFMELTQNEGGFILWETEKDF